MNNDPLIEMTENSISEMHPVLRQLGQNPRIWRMIQAVGIIMTLVAIGALIVRPQIAQLFPDAHALTTPIPIIIVTNVSYGTLKVDGIAVTAKPNDRNHPIILTKDKTTIELTAAPYRPVTCTIYAVTLKQNSGLSRCQTHYNDHGASIEAVNMNLGIDDLPPIPRQQLLDYLPTTLDWTRQLPTTVADQTHYATERGSAFPVTAITSEPLQARIQVGIDLTDTQSSFCQAILCPEYLNYQFQPTTPAYSAFQISTALTWQFLQGNGHALPSYPVINAADGYVDTLSFYLTYSASAGWQTITAPMGLPTVQTQVSQLLCTMGVETLIVQSPPVTLSQIGPLGQPGISGCLIYTKPTPNTPSPIITDPIQHTQNTLFLVHFGAIMAVNELAHQLLPKLPRATPEEVNEIVQHP